MQVHENQRVTNLQRSHVVNMTKVYKVIVMPKID